MRVFSEVDKRFIEFAVKPCKKLILRQNKRRITRYRGMQIMTKEVVVHHCIFPCIVYPEFSLVDSALMRDIEEEPFAFDAR